LVPSATPRITRCLSLRIPTATSTAIFLTSPPQLRFSQIPSSIT
jgi:hypothetical protein